MLGDDPRGEQLLAWFRERWDQTVKALDIMGKGGATGEGNAYGTSPTGSGFIIAANVAYTAAGDDLFASHPWFRQRLLYDAFAAYPGLLGGPGAPVNVPVEPIIEQASIGGDGRRACRLSTVCLVLNSEGGSTQNKPIASRILDFWTPLKLDSLQD